MTAALVEAGRVDAVEPMVVVVVVGMALVDGVVEVAVLRHVPTSQA